MVSKRRRPLRQRVYVPVTPPKDNVVTPHRKPRFGQPTVTTNQMPGRSTLRSERKETTKGGKLTGRKGDLEGNQNKAEAADTLCPKRFAPYCLANHSGDKKRIYRESLIRSVATHPLLSKHAESTDTQTHTRVNAGSTDRNYFRPLSHVTYFLFSFLFQPPPRVPRRRVFAISSICSSEHRHRRTKQEGERERERNASKPREGERGRRMQKRTKRTNTGFTECTHARRGMPST